MEPSAAVTAWYGLGEQRLVCPSFAFPLPNPAAAHSPGLALG